MSSQIIVNGSLWILFCPYASVFILEIVTQKWNLFYKKVVWELYIMNLSKFLTVFLVFLKDIAEGSTCEPLTQKVYNDSKFLEILEEISISYL